MARLVVYNRYLSTRGGGEKQCLALASALASSDCWDVTVLTDEAVDRRELADYFHIDLDDLTIHRARAGRLAELVLGNRRVPGLIKNLMHEWTLQREARRLDADVFVNNTQWSFIANPAAVGVYYCMFPATQDPLPSASRARAAYFVFVHRLTRLVLHRRFRRPIESYDHVLANSEFTREHIRTEWDRDSFVLFPPCQDMALTEIRREKIILNVGRFFPEFGEVHHKRQDVLLDQFLAMPELAARGWQLHFVGSVSDDSLTRAFLDRLKQRAEGAPVVFHTDLPFAALRELYNRATVYWHATGFGTDAEQYPDRQEHFGIVTVEAMSAGCIPVVIDSGGQREVVTGGVDGYLWRTTDELREFTALVADASESERDTMRAAARASAARFEMPEFRRRAVAIFDEYRTTR